jgi:preprotein translocase subunit SecD
MEERRPRAPAPGRSANPHRRDLVARTAASASCWPIPRQVDAAREQLQPLTQGAGLTGQRDWDLEVRDGNRIVLTPTKAGIDQAITQAMDTATEVVRKRIDALGTREPTIIRQGAQRIVVQVPGLKDPLGAQGAARQDRQA